MIHSHFLTRTVGKIRLDGHSMSQLEMESLRAAVPGKCVS